MKILLKASKTFLIYLPHIKYSINAFKRVLVIDYLTNLLQKTQHETEFNEKLSKLTEEIINYIYDSELII